MFLYSYTIKRVKINAQAIRFTQQRPEGKNIHNGIATRIEIKDLKKKQINHQH